MSPRVMRRVFGFEAVLLVLAVGGWIAHNSAVHKRFLAGEFSFADEALSSVVIHDQKRLADSVVSLRRCGFDLVVLHAVYAPA
jgi:hypothetical protein